MLEIIWGILFLGVFVYFIIISFQSTKIIRKEFGVFAALIFVLGLLLFFRNSKIEETELKTFSLQNETKGVKQNQLNGDSYFREKKIEDNLINEITITILINENNSGKKLLKAWTNRNGLSIGTIWRTESITVNKLDKINLYEYDVHGVLEWKILGLNLFYESKEFKGNIVL